MGKLVRVFRQVRDITTANLRSRKTFGVSNTTLGHYPPARSLASLPSQVATAFVADVRIYDAAGVVRS
jgi:hypothetical protein